MVSGKFQKMIGFYWRINGGRSLTKPKKPYKNRVFGQIDVVM
jgi:hypothetical protein